MSIKMEVKGKKSKSLSSFVIILLIITFILFGSYQRADAQQKTFRSPQEAVKSMVDAVKANDKEELSAIFGPAGKELISSGDEVADKTGRERFVKAYEEMNKLVREIKQFLFRYLMNLLKK